MIQLPALVKTECCRFKKKLMAKVLQSFFRYLIQVKTAGFLSRRKFLVLAIPVREQGSFIGHPIKVVVVSDGKKDIAKTQLCENYLKQRPFSSQKKYRIENSRRFFPVLD
jgi:hypothetical protein